MNEKQILLGHGSGGKLTHDLIKNLFMAHFDNPVLKQQTDSALLEIATEDIAFTTDSYVIDPLVFPGGNIGKLAVCGTVNDIAVTGALPLFISASFIMEEGLAYAELETIVKSMAEEANIAGVLIVTGDTKVVNKGHCDKLFINTAGIGVIEKKFKKINTGSSIETGDKIIFNGSLGDHGLAVMAARNFADFKTDIISDCCSLNKMIQELLQQKPGIKFMRDATRGGLAGILCEIAEKNMLGIEIEETQLFIHENVRGMCELLGFDPLYVANEGKVMIIAAAKDADDVVSILKNDRYGKNSTIIGEIVENHKGKALLKTSIGGKRIINKLDGEQLPKIC